MEQQRRHAEAKRELLASRYFKMPVVGFLPAALGPPQFRASPVDHARLIVQLCPPTSSLLQPLDQDTLDRFCIHLSRLHFFIVFVSVVITRCISSELLVLIKDGARLLLPRASAD